MAFTNIKDLCEEINRNHNQYMSSLNEFGNKLDNVRVIQANMMTDIGILKERTVNLSENFKDQKNKIKELEDCYNGKMEDFEDLTTETREKIYKISLKTKIVWGFGGLIIAGFLGLIFKLIEKIL
jgi:chromosome segregation ATPase